RMAGISNATIEQIDIARRVLGEDNLASVQNQFSPAFRASEPELRHCAGLGIAFLPYSPLGGSRRTGPPGRHPPRAARPAGPPRRAARRRRASRTVRAVRADPAPPTGPARPRN